jgi:hypothetical protein
MFLDLSDAYHSPKKFMFLLREFDTFRFRTINWIVVKKELRDLAIKVQNLITNY